MLSPMTYTVTGKLRLDQGPVSLADLDPGDASLFDGSKQEAKKALADPALQAKLVEQGIVPMGSTPEEFRAFVAEETEKWGKVVREAGIKL